MPTIVTIYSPDAAADLSFSVGVADRSSPQFGWSWSPKAGGFALSPPDALIPFAHDPDPYRKHVRHGFLPVTLEPAFTGQYMVYIHPPADLSAATPPDPAAYQTVQPPFPVETGNLSARLFNFAISFKTT